MKNQFKSHPWHGISPGEQAPELVNSYIEIVPTDTVKYEIDKESGHLKVDRPQKYSNYCPTLYGFIPRTYCGTLVGQFCAEKIGVKEMPGDGDPLDICILTEKVIPHGDILVQARPIGGFRMIDRGQADDKIIAVLFDDGAYGTWSDISMCPENLIARLQHYFLTYKNIPGKAENVVTIPHIYGPAEARTVISHSLLDYAHAFGNDSK
jgi:inorganic pyrophosphatase